MKPKIHKPVKLDIACGTFKREGYTGIDIANRPEVDIVHDLNVYPWPIATDSVESAFISHYIEHTPDLIAFMNELYRVMKVDGLVEIIAPYYQSHRAFQDPTHTRFISEQSMLYFSQEWLTREHLDHYPVKCNFSMEYAFGYFPDFDTSEFSEEKLTVMRRTNWNIVADIHFRLTKLEMPNG